MTRPSEVLEFWFPSDPDRANALWWGKSSATDDEIRARFLETRGQAKAGDLDPWATEARGRLALIIVLDQMSRNLFRDDPETYAADPKALALAVEGLELGHDRALRPLERVFFYMPLEHSEERALQARNVTLFEALASDVAAEPGVDDARKRSFDNYLDFAIRHRDVVDRFGRFPHRNTILGRSSSPEEQTFLTQPNSSF